jgi:peptidoglycan/LPS O-acetylase OafA/YrhL
VADAQAADARGFAYHPALDGLRGIAVAAVVAYHLGWIRGGYLGVDAFFVLSGFLITSLLVREHEADGHIGLRAFWARRARRLLPALLLLLVVLAVVARDTTPRRDFLGALGYVANWQHIWANVSYFDAFTQPSPLRHTWSLAVEEQFYLLWPIVVAVVLRIGGRRALAVTCLAGIAASAVLMAAWYEPADPSRVYYGTDTRAQLLLVGALLALLSLRRCSQTLGMIALALCVAAMVALPDHAHALYRGGMLLNATFVAVVLAAVVSRPDARLARVLGVAPLRGLGKVSYGVYLWSWPVIVLITSARTGLSGPALAGFRLAVIASVTLLSYAIVERPVRRWSVDPQRVLVGAAAALVATALVAMVVVPHQKRNVVYLTDGPSLSDLARRGETPAPVVSSVPVPVPVPPVPPAPPTGTASAPAALLRPPHRIAIVGDSVAASLAFGLDAVAPQFGIDVVKRAFPGCGVAVGVPLGPDDRPPPWAGACERVPVALEDLVARRNPDVVVWLSSLDAADRQENGVPLHWGRPEHRRALLAAMDAQVGRLTARGARVVFIAPPFPAPSRLNLRSSEADLTRLREYRALLMRYVHDHPTLLALVDLDPIVCPGGAPCPEVVDGDELRPDGMHFTTDSAPIVARRLVPLILASLSAPASPGCAGPRCSCSPAWCRRQS